MKFQLKVGNERLACDELKVSLYKELLKCTYGDEPDTFSFVQTVGATFEELTNRPASFFIEQMSVFDLMSCLIQLRINSIGDKTNINLNSEESKKTLELRLDWVNEDLLEFNNKHIKNLIKVGPVELETDSPSVQRLLEKTDEEYLYFIKSVTVNDNTNQITTNREAKEITEKLPVKLVIEVIRQFESFVKQIKSFNFLQRYGVDETTLVFIPSIESIIWFTKLIFNESIQSFYDNIFHLAKISYIPPSYTESCSVGDYLVYTGMLRQSIAQQSENSQEEAVVGDPNAINDFAEDG